MPRTPAQRVSMALREGGLMPTTPTSHREGIKVVNVTGGPGGLDGHRRRGSFVVSVRVDILDPEVAAGCHLRIVEILGEAGYRVEGHEVTIPLVPTYGVQVWEPEWRTYL